MNNYWTIVVVACITASLFYWIGYLKGFRSGVTESKEMIRNTISSIYGLFYEMKKKDV